ncbi:hypothetical protein FD755_009582, partial [Muntiacus reevesi]
REMLLVPESRLERRRHIRPSKLPKKSRCFCKKEEAEEMKRAQQLHNRVCLRQLEVKLRGLEVPDKHFLTFVLVLRIVARLCLNKIFSGFFVKVTFPTINSLWNRIKPRSSALQEDSLLFEPPGNPYVTQGFPNLKFLQELNLKHRQSKVKNKSVPLTDNRMIEQHWGKFGVICLEDFIHKVAFPGKNFQVVSGFLGHFHLSVAHCAIKNRVGFLKEGDSPGYGGKHNTQLTGQVNETQNL